ncbi:hypothetical protein VUR80DRAFT_8517 [Thermomyces stellatus]
MCAFVLVGYTRSLLLLSRLSLSFPTFSSSSRPPRGRFSHRDEPLMVGETPTCCFRSFSLPCDLFTSKGRPWNRLADLPVGLGVNDIPIDFSTILGVEPRAEDTYQGQLNIESPGCGKPGVASSWAGGTLEGNFQPIKRTIFRSWLTTRFWRLMSCWQRGRSGAG